MEPPKYLDNPPRHCWHMLALAFFFLAIVLAVTAGLRFGTKPKFRVACVGDSTTWGTYETRAKGVTYPDWLAKLGRRELQVGNFGVGAKTLLRRSGRAWCETGELEQAIAFQPDVVVIMFGVNEIACPDLLDEFLPDALWLVEQLKRAIPHVNIFLATPTPLAPEKEKSRENEELRTKIIPDLQQVAQMTGCRMIDVNANYPATLGYLPDGIHPNAQGNRLIAQLVFSSIKQEEKGDVRKGR